MAVAACQLSLRRSRSFLRRSRTSSSRPWNLLFLELLPLASGSGRDCDERESVLATVMLSPIHSQGRTESQARHRARLRCASGAPS